MHRSLAFGAPEYTLVRAQWIPASLEEVFAFFEDPHNLKRITPPELGFDILSIQPQDIQTGTRILYRLRWMGFPYQWHTEIHEWERGKMFVDNQERGPYILWRHTHRFTASEGGVLMEDEVRYRLPFGWVGVLAHRLIVRRQVEDIFNFRRARIAEIYSDGVAYSRKPG